MALNQSYMLTDSGGSGKKKDSISTAVEKAVQTAVGKIQSGVDKASKTTQNNATTTTDKPTSSGVGPGKNSGASASSAAPSVTQDDIDNTAYAAALSAAEAARQGMPTYSGSFDDQIAQLYEKINGRGEFSYDLNGDAFWQQYKDQYGQAAKRAMTDTMGQAAALTGGYGSSYGQAVGQQAYDRQMEGLLDVAPELYQMAYQRYNDAGDRMLNQFNMARQMASDEYGRYTDDYNRWLTERGYADEREALAYSREKDNRAYIQSLIALGYTPTAQELADAGMTTKQYKALAAAYAPEASSSGSKSSGKIPSKKEAGKEYDQMATTTVAEKTKNATQDVAEKIKRLFGGTK